MKQLILNYFSKMRKHTHYLFLLSLPVIMSFTLGDCQGFLGFFHLPCTEFSQYTFNDSKNLYAVTSTGEILTVEDNCQIYLIYKVSNNHSLNRIEQIINYTYFVVGDSGTIVRKEGGITAHWDSIGSPTNENLWDVCDLKGISDSIVFAVGENGTVIKSTDEGNSWFLLPAFTTEDLYEIICFHDNTISVFGSNATAFKSTDGGNSWNEMQLFGESDISHQNGGPDVYGSFYLNADTGYVFGEFGAIFYTSDGGSNWTPGIVPIFERINTAYFISPDSGMIAGDNGKVRFTVNGGATWVEDTSVTNLTTQNINQFSIIDNSVAVIVGDSGTVIFVSQDSSALTSVHNNPAIVTEYKLNQNYPNPFNPSTKISWQSPVGGHHSLIIYDVIGNKVATLVDEYKPAGSYEVEFDGHSDSIRNLTSGIYFYRLTIGNEFIETKKMILLK